ncbi:MAG TPA: transglutaminase domain-containing protein, partial [Acidimicrobiales bacterium]|nr:transglutaminase domain-containing protein [Acidimicrobiales bacterium]
MGVVAAAAVAVATCGAAAAGGGAAVGPVGVPFFVLAVALAAAVVGVAARASTKVLPTGKDVVVLTAVTVAGFVGLYLVGWTTREHVAEIARLLPLAVVGLSLLWPEPNVLRYCLLLAAGALLGTAGEQAGSRLAVGAAVVALALALVTTNRLTAASGPRLGQAPPARGRRVAAEAVAVLAIVGLLAALAAALLPPRDPSGGRAGGRESALPRPAAPPLEGEDDLDVTAGTDAPGGGFVLLVDASKPDMWRVMTYDHWDGEAWSRSPEDVAVLDRDIVEPGVGDLAVAPGPRSPDRLQVVTLLAESATVLAAAARPTHVASEGDVGQGADASLYPQPPLFRGDRYLVFSDGSQAPGRVLRAIGDPPAGAVPSDVARSYLQLPQVSAPVRALAAEITAGESTAYGRVRAVEGWIDDHTTVTADTEPVATGVDPLEAFLFDERPGSSEQAATSMAVMLRALGIPARIAVGFLPGTRTAPDREFLVRSRDAHAWVEVWFPTAGWQRFDPTGKAPDAHAEESVWDRLVRFLGRLWPLVVLVVV